MQSTHAPALDVFLPAARFSPLVWAHRLEAVSFYVLIGILAWAPFPLGSNRPWSWSILTLLVAVCWSLWAAGTILKAEAPVWLLRRIMVPGLLAGLALLWGIVQMFPIVPAGWLHPVWNISENTLGHDLEGTISLDSWRTGTELMKLFSYAMAAWVAFALTQRAERAERLLDALIAIATLYALYALALAYAGLMQFEIFYPGKAPSVGISGPFVSRNNFATFAGLGMLCAWVRLFALGGAHVVTSAGFRAFMVSSLHFAFGRGWLPLFGGIINFSLLVASASRAGFLAVMAGGVIMLVFSGVIALKHSRSRWSVLGVLALVALAVVLFLINGAALQARLPLVLQEGVVDDVRTTLWATASRMIADRPLLGFGLGTFETAYPLYAGRVLPFTIDKAHNDYLELAAGWGVPAAALWWMALAWLAGQCARGIFVRRRERGYPLLAAGATTLVAIHAIFDFSLQIPAIALTFAVILGMGVAQSFSSRSP